MTSLCLSLPSLPLSPFLLAFVLLLIMCTPHSPVLPPHWCSHASVTHFHEHTHHHCSPCSDKTLHWSVHRFGSIVSGCIFSIQHWSYDNAASQLHNEKLGSKSASRFRRPFVMNSLSFKREFVENAQHTAHLKSKRRVKSKAVINSTLFHIY